MAAILKTNLNRTVLRDREGDREIVVKRFHSPGTLRRLADGRRAAREFQVLEALHAFGLPVPEPLELRKRDEHWEVVSAWLPGTNALDQYLLGNQPVPASAGDLARILARLLARTWSSGLVHSDLHTGNVLLDAQGQVWLIDFQHATLLSEVSNRRRHHDLVVLAAEVREQVSRRFRARFLLELLRSLEPAERESLGDPTVLAQRIEEEARLHRRHRVHRRQLRWTRESSSCRAFELSPLLGWLNREFDRTQEEELSELVSAEFDETSTLLSNGFEVMETARHGSNWILVRAQDESMLREAWYAAVRVRDHGLPVPTPCVFLEEPEPRMLLREEPPGCYLARALAEDSAREPIGGLMALLGGLHDRGLALADLSLETFRAVNEKLTFGTPLEIVAATPSRRTRDRQAALALLHCEHEEWIPSYLAVWRGDRSELAALREELPGD